MDNIKKGRNIIIIMLQENINGCYVYVLELIFFAGTKKLGMQWFFNFHHI